MSPSPSNYQACSQPIRVPTNAYPSQHTSSRNAPYPRETQSAVDTLYFSAVDEHRFPDSFAQSFREQFSSFTSSYSRASALYIAENLPLPGNTGSSHDGDIVLDEERQFVSLQDNPEIKDLLSHSENFDGKSLLMAVPAETESKYGLYTSLSRHTTVGSVLSQHLLPPSISDREVEWQIPKSTFTQSVFNAVNVLIGIGILTLPLALRYAGWCFGALIFIFCATVTNYTAKILAKCLDASPGAMTYGDMGMAAFGNRGQAFIGMVFIAELATLSVAMVTLLGDGIQAIFLSVDLISARLISLAIIAPTLFLPLRKLAFTSLIGIVSCACLVVIVLYDGLSKTSKPGSLIDPMETEMIISDASHLFVSFGLVMACFAGHAVFPSIYRDMEDPKQYNRMVNIAYSITTAVCIITAAAGYLMFGQETMQEITQNLAVTPGYYKILNYVALWLVVMTPIAKYGLIVNPLNITLELCVLNLPVIEQWCKSSLSWRRKCITALCRISICLATVFVATVFPGFDRVMSLLGALFSFGISAIFPILCYQRLYQGSLSTKEKLCNTLIMITATTMAALGTVWSFISK